MLDALGATRITTRAVQHLHPADRRLRGIAGCVGGLLRMMTEMKKRPLCPSGADINSPRLTQPSPSLSSLLKTSSARATLVPPAPSAFSNSDFVSLPSPSASICANKSFSASVRLVRAEAPDPTGPRRGAARSWFPERSANSPAAPSLRLSPMMPRHPRKRRTGWRILVGAGRRLCRRQRLEGVDRRRGSAKAGNMAELQQGPLHARRVKRAPFLSKRRAIARNPYFIGVFVTTSAPKTRQ